MHHAQKRELTSVIRDSAKSCIKGIAGLLPFPSLLRNSGQKIFLPFYHLAGDAEYPHISQLYTVRSSSLFEADLDFLLQHFQPIDLNSLIAITKGELPKPDKPVLHLSFDDGLSECKAVIASILLRKGIPATFFINSAFLDNKGLMFRYKISLCLDLLSKMPYRDRMEFLKQASALFKKIDLLSATYSENAAIDTFAKNIGLDFNAFLQDSKPYLSTEDLKTLISQGFTIGSHSIDHPRYADIEPEEQLRQTIESQKYLTHNFNLNYKVFAFPFSDDGVKKPFFETILKEENFDLTFGTAGLKKDEITGNLHRFPMESQQLDSAKKLLRSEFLYYLMKAPFGKNKLRR